MVTQHDPLQNRILRSMPKAIFDRIVPTLEAVTLPAGTTWVEAGVPLRAVLFPTSAVLSLIQALPGGESIEVGMVGREGMLGLALVMGLRNSTCREVVLAEGHAYRMRAEPLLEEFRRGGTLARMLLRYFASVACQMAQTATCNRFHALDQQLCRWLLCALDRGAGNPMSVTQEVIAHRLGVRREGVTEAASKLQAAGVIQYSRGRIQILDRAGLEARACVCHHNLTLDYETLLAFYRES